ncbi:MAG: hypothetical protein KTR15_08725 [Phycisphaeraceae bacterium]|nr:hypothetical protein [Phycisphaeraceae bacterium]
MWTFDELFLKAATLARRGLNHPNPESSEVPLWCFVSLELLARSVLSKTNIALLADPQDGNNILYACGFPSTKSPKSIPAKTVFHRCTVICPGFTTQEYNTCMLWMNQRNEELHTGTLALDSLGSSEWMPRFFQISNILLVQASKVLEDYVGADHAPTAITMIDALSEDNKKTAFESIKTAKDAFESQEVSDRLRQIEEGQSLRLKDYRSRSIGYDIICPACEGPAIVTGDIVRSTVPHDDDGDFVQEDVRIPTKLHCYSCGLELVGHPLLHAIDQGNQFTKTDYLDPKDYYEIEFDPDQHYEGEYMNC